MNNPLAKLTVAELNKLAPYQIPEDSRVENVFVRMYNAIHGTDKGALMYAKAKFDFLKIMTENQALKDCTQLSLYGCFLDAAVCGLSLEGGNKPHVYIIPRPYNVGTKETPKWEKRATLTISPYGELVQRMRAGQIKHADNPVIVYEGDVFQPSISDSTGLKNVKYQALIPRRQNAKIIGAWIRIQRLDGSVDYQWMLDDDIKRLSGYSQRQNKGTANALYTSNNGQIDPGFLEAKMIKHAFRTYPKVRTGEHTVLQTDEIPEENIDYGLEKEEESFDAGTPEQQPEPTQVNDQDGVF